MTSKETGDEAIVFGDEFVADEILARLPFRCASRCTALSKRFQQLLVGPHFWFRHRRLGAPPELPHIARLYRHFSCKTGHGFSGGAAPALSAWRLATIKLGVVPSKQQSHPPCKHA
ncbi:hypothetical protein ACQ4PT_058044 [Festuca glaucescens]